ncbi:50S ribosomal protein L3 [Candidatus Pacearchaeota archaeon]|nr:50S ribosomal protein L3 [Candidatus Pacearchaeota archaeon]
MPTTKSPRKGSLQYWPRKRAAKMLPSVNWDAIDSKGKLKGFICYKAGMKSAIVKDSTEHSMTKDKQKAIPVTILECPPMKILSVRLYKKSKVLREILAENLDKELKRQIKMPKKGASKKIDDIKEGEYDDLRIICYSVVKKTNIKTKPDVAEIGINGNLDEKLAYIKENLGKEINVTETFEDGQLVDLRGVTTGRGFCGPVKRFGITLKSHKSEKGQRRPGSLGPWHPARVIFRVPMAGQLGMFTRAIYNNKIVKMGKADEFELKNIKNYGDVKTEYLIVNGSIQGPSKRQLIATEPLRPTKKQSKKNFEFITLR